MAERERVQLQQRAMQEALENGGGAIDMHHTVGEPILLGDAAWYEAAVNLKVYRNPNDDKKDKVVATLQKGWYARVDQIMEVEILRLVDLRDSKSLGIDDRGFSMIIPRRCPSTNAQHPTHVSF